MKVIFISFSSNRGGAGKAASRIKNVVGAHLVDLIMISNEELQKNRKNLFSYYIYFLKRICSLLLTKVMITKNPIKHSLNIFGNNTVRSVIKESSLLHIHWINNEFLSIKNFHLLAGKSIITLHDEWFYCGAEHCAIEQNTKKARFIEGYTKENKDVFGIDLNRHIWELKKRHYSSLKNVIFTVPSNWMKARALSSCLLKNMDIRVIPNPINTEVFLPKETSVLKKKLCIDEEDFVIAFGAVGGKSNWSKGFDLLLKALAIFKEQKKDLWIVKLLLFGGDKGREYNIQGFEVINIGHIYCEDALAEVYSVSSITVTPSRIESFAQVAAESLSCETPVVAFDYSGLQDIVVHKETGYLAEPFDPKSLAIGLLWFYAMATEERKKIGENGRKFIQEKFENEKIGRKFLSLYNEISDRQQKLEN